MVERTRETTDPAALLFPLFDVFSRLPKKKAEERTPGAGTSASTSLDPDTPSSSSSSTTTSSPPVAPAFLISPFYPPIASASSNLVGVGFSTPCKGLYTRCASVRVDYLSPSVYVQEDGRFVLRVFFFLRNFFFFFPFFSLERVPFAVSYFERGSRILYVNIIRLMRLFGRYFVKNH